ncbi:hypothetical protein FRC04_003070 [Tulasnella sp. 424]|nr:hypothetical protein FRC04_003070 [Tulasnella sp. 424]KAG8981139.1 hypothetical protein FRC05_004039 [Tulasnella sp. 425]
MGKKKIPVPESAMLLENGCPHLSSIPAGPDSIGSEGVPPHPVIDTHTHLVSTFGAYRSKYPDGQFLTIHDFVRGYFRPAARVSNSGFVTDLVDVYCEAPVMKQWREVADSALTEEQRATDWGGVQYHFVIGVHPHEARHYNDDVEKDIIEAASHPRCVGMGEMGLDYHYDNSPREIQREALKKQLAVAVGLNKPLTIHTREADDDILQILKENVPKDHRVISDMILSAISSGASLTSAPSPLRILLETDAPYMVPGNLSVQSLGLKPGARLPFSHSGMIPWTAHFVAEAATEAAGGAASWSAEDILRIGAENAQRMYGL